MHILFAAHPAEVQQLQGFHEAQAYLSCCVREGVQLGGECKFLPWDLHKTSKIYKTSVYKSKNTYFISSFNFLNSSSSRYFVTLFLVSRTVAFSK